MIIIECAKAITHEYRHLFQLFWATMMKDERAKRWNGELKNPVSSETANILSNSFDVDKYASQEIELDAFAFTKYFLEKYEDIKVVYPNEKYESLIKKYILVNKKII